MKIGLTGTMSVGKTTLVNALKEVPEFKDYEFSTERSKYLRDLGIPLNTDSTLKGQTIFLAERCAELLKPEIITDRTIIDVMAFTNLSTSISYLDKNNFINYASRFITEYDYVFYVSPKDTIIENNGVRTIDEEYREQIDKEIINLLNNFGGSIKNLYVLYGDTQTRIEDIKKYIFPYIYNKI